MAVSLPTAADVRKAREQAARSAAERAEAARTPLLAVLGAGEYAVTAVTKAVTDATRAVTDARTRAADARGRAGELPHRMSGEELRKFLDELRAQVEKVYAEFAERGEQTWGQLRTQPQLQQAVATLKTYTEKLDAHVDTLVDEARDAGEKALGTVSRQTRSAGERVARSTQRFSAGSARIVTVVSEEASTAVAESRCRGRRRDHQRRCRGGRRDPQHQPHGGRPDGAAHGRRSGCGPQAGHPPQRPGRGPDHGELTPVRTSGAPGAPALGAPSCTEG